MKTVKVKYGSQVHPVSCPDTHTIGQVIADPTCKAVLGYGDNVKPLVSGVEQTTDTVISDDSTVTLETRMNSKAQRELVCA